MTNISLGGVCSVVLSYPLKLHSSAVEMAFLYESSSSSVLRSSLDRRATLTRSAEDDAAEDEAMDGDAVEIGESKGLALRCSTSIPPYKTPTRIMARRFCAARL